ncbi:uncharacterized protein EV420DRAFT_1543100 [Desarmillaria tabescens]|uniref:Neuroguidin n=1 Tax=Armillaria tabescens TaxID=1929756 RepID=A0AA39KCC1_ARMTA|nr:uncharacterized protein EV420DRAFT_1543100 [Desarmillaria tabescens]KAK0458557.1 hypothetical protein EV420DRAFT_1543100 [Desarmillaria tabescens]
MADPAVQVSTLHDEMATSISSVREVIQDLASKPNDTSDGISLLSLKNHVLLSYMQSLLLLSCLSQPRSPPQQPFSDPDRDTRGDGPGDLRGRMRYQTDKLVRLAKDDTAVDATNEGEEEGNDGPTASSDGIYRPPRLAPTPYIPTSKDKNKKRAPIPTTLSALRDADPTLPYTESTSGLGSTPSLNNQSSRARYLKRLTEFEEEQFGRVMLSKKEARRRRRDEEALAMGGGLSGVGEEGKGRVRRGGRGFDDEFADVLRDVDRGNGRGGDGYDELRQRSKRGSVLERSRDARRESLPIEDDAPMKKRKRSRFEMERKAVKKRK